ncbi:MAG TPA: LmeA family phospholipid-binding protein [Thermomicrobiales bacterium]|nr:LmeA family phospholipid-binding protein [Thermomicrobiales bacterium]
MRGCLTVLILLVLLGAALVAAAYVLLPRQPGLAARAQLTPVPVSSAAAVRFDQKVATMQSAPASTTVEITEQEATSKLVEALAADPSAPRIDKPQVAFRDGQIYVSGVTHDTPVPVNVVIYGRVQARDGQLYAVVDGIDTGQFPLPGQFKEMLVSRATDLSALNSELPIYVEDVQVREGRLALTGRPK